MNSMGQNVYFPVVACAVWNVQYDFGDEWEEEEAYVGLRKEFPEPNDKERMVPIG